ncbi:imidazole glycerol phosphate synthase subunit HisH [Herbaspirillum chlorophenolicum]|uniref:Imidazole glycerol phosphate synthase subunit HisH n=1 Tax=Herbaspirillum chlorophenolicum TaxID=211589 RepID=A0ABW8ES68_9BURK
MSRATIGILDYEVGNLASVRHALHSLDYRCRISADPETLDQTDLLLLPGVGAFPHAMKSLAARGLDHFLRERARRGKPVLGICLGMQLLADSSNEICLTAGLGLIPGRVEHLERGDWHIGWNNIEIIRDDPVFGKTDGFSVYFNHSHVFNAAPEYQAAVARMDGAASAFTVAVRRDNVVGLQFHPEKSQRHGRELLSNVIERLIRA